MGERNKYLELCKRFEGILPEKEIEYFKNNFDGGTIEKDFLKNKLELLE